MNIFDTDFSRRQFSALGAAAILPAITASPAGAAPPAGADGEVVDFGAGFPETYARVKSSATFGDTPVFGGFIGTMYALVGEDMIPMCGYSGYQLDQARIVEPDTPGGQRKIQLRQKEGILYLDLATGKRLEYWKNPLTGETVEANPWLLDGTCGTVETERSSQGFHIDAFSTDSYTGLAQHKDAEEHSIAYRQPWRRVGDRYLVMGHTYNKFRNPVTPEGWPKASTGEFVTQHQHYRMAVQAAAMDDPDASWAPFTMTQTRKLPWFPFMRMGQSGIKGGLLGLSHQYRITGTIEDVPVEIRHYLERYHPEQLQPMTSWENTHKEPGGTWQYFARTVPPETPGYKPG